MRVIARALGCKVLAACFAFSVQAETIVESADKLTQTLSDMGYEEVLIEDCRISFLRRVEPTEENNYFFAYERFINLDLLQDLSQAKVEVIHAGGEAHNVLNLELDDTAGRAYLNVVSFSVWLRATYPDAVWPLRHPSRQNLYSPIAEFELHRRLEHLQTFSRWVSYSKYGGVTFIEQGVVVIGFEDPDKLEELWVRLVEYSIDAECAVEF